MAPSLSLFQKQFAPFLLAIYLFADASNALLWHTPTNPSIPGALLWGTGRITTTTTRITTSPIANFRIRPLAEQQAKNWGNLDPLSGFDSNDNGDDDTSKVSSFASQPTRTTTTRTPSINFNSNSSSNNNNNNNKKKNLRQFTRYLEVECWKRAELRSLEPVLQAVANACKEINRIVQRAQTDDIYGAAAAAATAVVGQSQSQAQQTITNIQGEVQQKLDVLCNAYLLRAFCGSSRVISSVASEEEDEPRCCSNVMNDPAFASGEYIAVFDPLDGSQNIDASLPVGTIFGIYRPPPGTAMKDNDAAFLQSGNSLVAAGYCLYSATTVLVLTMGSGVDGFTLDPDTGKFLHTHPDIRIPLSGSLYSFNEANFRDFDEPIQRFLNSLKEKSRTKTTTSDQKQPPPQQSKKTIARYVGALVADTHNVLINGGIYGYPATFQNRNGKLRLLYESNPMAMIMEQAGGAGSTGFGRIMDVQPKNIHQRVPTFLGSLENVFELDQFCQYYSSQDESQQTLYE
ncbi:hypothetical protein ACA910_013333 [Epithemia clementina (nom. ined.)]